MFFSHWVVGPELAVGVAVPFVEGLVGGADEQVPASGAEAHRRGGVGAQGAIQQRAPPHIAARQQTEHPCKQITIL